MWKYTWWELSWHFQLVLHKSLREVEGHWLLTIKMDLNQYPQSKRCHVPSPFWRLVKVGRKVACTPNINICSTFHQNIVHFKNKHNIKCIRECDNNISWWVSTDLSSLAHGMQDWLLFLTVFHSQPRNPCIGRAALQSPFCHRTLGARQGAFHHHKLGRTAAHA